MRENGQWKSSAQSRNGKIFNVPKWITRYVDLWYGRLNLYEWLVKYDLSLDPARDYSLDYAAVGVNPGVNEAAVSFRVDIKDTPGSRRDVIHELLHIKHGRLDAVVNNVIIKQLPEGQRDMAKRAYAAAYEPFVHAIAESFYDLEMDLDKANEQLKKAAPKRKVKK